MTFTAIERHNVASLFREILSFILLISTILTKALFRTVFLEGQDHVSTNSQHTTLLSTFSADFPYLMP